MVWRVLEHGERHIDEDEAQSQGATPTSGLPTHASMEFGQMKILVADMISRKYNVQQMRVERIADQSTNGTFSRREVNLEGINDNPENIFNTLEAVQSDVLLLYEKAKKTATQQKRERLAIIADLKSYDSARPVQFQILGYICS
jgi:hypothetical protein